MTLEELKTQLPEPLAAELLARFDVFQTETESDDIDAFVSYMHAQNWIDDDLFEQLVSQEQIELTAFDMTTADDEDLTLAGADEDGCSTDGTGAGAVAKKNRPKYTILTMLGKGAMGLVHLAKDVDLQRKVAYKELLGEVAVNKTVLGRFLSEVQITAQLDHPNVVPVYSLDVRQDGSFAYSMKLVQGKTLKQLIQETKQFYDKQQPLDEEHALTTLLDHFLKVCDAMAFAHNKGVIHRDLKPANIMVGKYKEVYVMDWGIARLIKAPDQPELEELVELVQPDSDEPIEEMTQVGQIVGTPRYMSPQQAAGKNRELDGRSDQFALGLILFELIALKPGFTAKNQIELLKKVLQAHKEPLVHYHPKAKIPTELQAIVHKATALKIEDRYSSVGDMAHDIRRFLRGESVSVLPDNSLRKLLRWIGRNQQKTLTAVMVVLLLSASATIWSMYRKQLELAASRAHEKQLGHFLTLVARQTQQIDSHFLQIEGLLAELSSAATIALTHSQPSQDRFYLSQDFDQPGKQPPDLRLSPHYGKPISIDWPVYKLAPGVNLAHVQPWMSRLNLLRYDFQDIFVKSHTGGTQLVAPAQVRSLLAEKGVPLIWSFVGLEAGVHFAYPGKGGYKESYDPRERPWYKLSAHKHGFHWGVPYLDAQGQGVLVPCTTALYDDQTFIGVAGVEMTLDYIVNNLMQIPHAASVRLTYLLNEKGEVVVNSDHKPQAEGAPQKLANPDIVAQVLRKSSGYLETRGTQTPILWAYYRLNSLGWYYVVEAEMTQLFAQQGTEPDPS